MRDMLFFGEPLEEAADIAEAYDQHRTLIFTVDSDTMSEEGRQDYLAAYERTIDPSTRRAEIGRMATELLPHLNENDRAALMSLLSSPLKMTEETQNRVRQIGNPLAKVHADTLIELNLAQARARREMALIARDEYYDLKLRKTAEAGEELERWRRELRLMSVFDEKARSRLAKLPQPDEIETQADTLAKLRAFDKLLFADVNGYMLETIHFLRELHQQPKSLQSPKPGK